MRRRATPLFELGVRVILHDGEWRAFFDSWARG
jgi:hypothetical protein